MDVIWVMNTHLDYLPKAAGSQINQGTPVGYSMFAGFCSFLALLGEDISWPEAGSKETTIQQLSVASRNRILWIPSPQA